jgi:shikimate kinase
LLLFSRQTGAKPELRDNIGGMSRYILSKTVVMIGMMGAGKTAIGTALARLIDVPFLDSDAQIEKAANMPIPEIFETYGEPFFRDKEALVLARLLEGAPCILSTGGGAYLQASNRKLIARIGLAVWLKADRELLWARVRHKSTRPLLQVENPQARLFELLEEREPVYSEAGLVVDADPNFSIQDMAEKVLAALVAHPSRCLEKVN